MSKHTSGPWKVSEPFPHVVAVRDGFPVTIADAAYRNHDFPSHRIELDEGMANARLIAAAPDLLAALEELAEGLEGANRDSPQSMRMSIPGWAGKARAAITKAKGE